jgi:hypothetical protein
MYEAMDRKDENVFSFEEAEQPLCRRNGYEKQNVFSYEEAKHHSCIRNGITNYIFCILKHGR